MQVTKTQQCQRSSKMDIKDYIALQERRRRGKLSATEQRTLDAWLENTEGINMAKEIKQINQLADRYKTNYEPDVENGWAQLQERMSAAKKAESEATMQVTARRSILRIAAAILLVAAVAAAIYTWLPRQPEMLVVETSAGQQEEVLLDDGTRIVLNENSKLSFPKRLADMSERVVQLRGEAYFDVSENPEKPFKLTTSQTQITVLGTAFNVRAYPHETITEVEVSEGKVAFGVLNSEAAIILEANDRATFDTSSNKLSRRKVAALNANAWYTHQLTFKNTPLEEVFSALERYYKVEIELANPQIAACHFTGNFQDLEVAKVIESVSVGLGLRTEEVASGQYKIYGRGCS